MQVLFVKKQVYQSICSFIEAFLVLKPQNIKLLKSEISKVKKYKYKYNQTITRHLQFITHGFRFSLMLFLFHNLMLNTSTVWHV